MNIQNAPERIRSSLVTLLAVGAIAIMIIDSVGLIEPLFGFLRDPIAYVMGWSSAQVNPVDNLLDGPRDLTTALQKIEELEQSVTQLERENEELRELQGEYQQLEALLNRAQVNSSLQRLTASVIAYDSNPYFQSVIINAGSNFGVRAGMPVESDRGLVGQIYRVSGNASQVLLLTDGQSSIPVRLGNSRATGILRGGGLGGDLRIDWLDLDAEIVPGELVITSGIGGRFPENLSVGRALDVSIQDTGLHQTVRALSDINFEDLEFVSVITNFTQIETDLFEAPEAETP